MRFDRGQENAVLRFDIGFVQDIAERAVAVRAIGQNELAILFDELESGGCVGFLAEARAGCLASRRSFRLSRPYRRPGSRSRRELQRLAIAPHGFDRGVAESLSISIAVLPTALPAGAIA